MSSFRWGIIACPSQTNSQMTVWELRQPPVFTSLYYCFSFQPQKHASTICSLTQSLLGADQATISHLKEEIWSYQGVQKILTFLIDIYKLSQVLITHFLNGFGMLWGLPTCLYILVCHSVTPLSISSYNISSERELKYLSFGQKNHNVY